MDIQCRAVNHGPKAVLRIILTPSTRNNLQHRPTPTPLRDHPHPCVCVLLTKVQFSHLRFLGIVTRMNSRTMTPTGIPPELVLEILTYISDGHKNLSACCLVCRTWRRLAQPSVFSELSLSLESHCHPWNQKFTTYPHLSQYVTRLNLWGGNWEEADDVLSPESQPTFLEGPATLELLRRLPNIKYLKMHDFALPSERKIEALSHFARLEWLGMYEVVFNETEALLDLMSQLVNLKGLHIKDVRVASHASKDLIGPILHDHVDAVPKRLRNLKLQDSGASLYIFSWLSGGVFNLSDLTDLTLSWGCSPTNHHPPLPYQLPSYVDPFISIVGARIKHLRLNIETPDFNAKSNINYMFEHFIAVRALSSFIGLETLNVDSINRYNNNDVRRLVDIERLLQHLMLPCLQKICVTMRFALNTADDLPSYKELPLWARLDALLAGSKFPSFQQLKLIIHVESFHWDAHKFGLWFEDSNSDDEDDSSTIVIPPLVTKHPWPEHPPTVDDVAALIAEQLPTLASRGCLLFCPDKMHRS
ncbi:hypothetical protein EDD18DRAFT_286925 [Armillaria luteobubalina]|uniref:F-box domain-containing protein n=1 Tax=Armillaria luteobubalina TaxID=153913 RepID=A0AA39UM12_9AGAR|nr:hypothetical protein EDD18DRAFT_286925 [Armillaria luteobubalina]